MEGVSLGRQRLAAWLLAAICGLALCGSARADLPDWRPVAAEDLAMTEEPQAPGAPAIILYMEVRRDDSAAREDFYQQVKILTDEGRKYANIEIAFDSQSERLRDIEARTIRRDGTIVPFAGEIFEKPIASATDAKVLAKTLALSGVEVGSVIEFRYTRRNRSISYWPNDTRWILSNALFTRAAHYAFRGRGVFRYSAPLGLPPGTPPIVSGKGGTLSFDLRNVAAFESEEYSPPEVEIRQRLDIIYAWDWDRPAKNVDDFWKRYAAAQRDTTNNYLLNSRALRSVVQELAPEGEPPEQRLRKLYAACAALRNKSYEPERSDEEVEREDERSPTSARDVWRRQYGWAGQINLLFYAMVREAGFDAAEVWVANRARTFFDKRQMTPGPLDTRLIAVKLADREVYLSPGTRFLPFGALPWGATAVTGLRIDRESHAWIDVPSAQPGQARELRVARMTLSKDGVLRGRVRATYTGTEAFWRRHRENNEDAAHKREFLKDDLLGALGDSAVVTVVGDPDWEGSGDFVVEYDVELGERVLSAGGRRVFPMAMFVANTTKAFQADQRTHPMYFRYPYEVEEDVEIELPVGWKLDALPDGRVTDQKLARYSILAVKLAGTPEAVRVRRLHRMALLLLRPSAYPEIREFFQQIRAGDEQQIVVRTE